MKLSEEEKREETNEGEEESAVKLALALSELRLGI